MKEPFWTPEQIKKRQEEVNPNPPYQRRSDPECQDPTWYKEWICSNNEDATGYGMTPEQAIEDSQRKAKAIEDFIKQPEIVQLRALVNQDHFMSSDVDKMLKLIVKILSRMMS